MVEHVLWVAIGGLLIHEAGRLWLWSLKIEKHVRRAITSLGRHAPPS